jgi:2-hydroxy-6-oxonona-2,4-dienedioate hydrolase
VVAGERWIEVDGLPSRYLEAGEGDPLVLLHALGESSSDWQWVIPGLARTHHVYAPDLPGFGDSAKPAADYSPAFYERFVAGLIDALRLPRVAVAGNSLGGLAALRLGLSQPSRIGALILVDSAGLGRYAAFALRSLTAPGYGELAVAWAKTPPGAAWRAWSKAQLLFAHPQLAPAAWTAEQYRLARLPGFLDAALAALRGQLDPGGQREVLLDRLARLEMPTLIVWGAWDRVFPPYQARDAVARLPKGSLALVPDCGHMPHIERPEAFVAALEEFLGPRSSP